MSKNLLIITQRVDKNDQLLGFFIDWLDRFAVKFGKITILCLEKGNFKLPDNVKVISLGKDKDSSKPVQLFNFYKLIWGLRSNYDSVFVHMNPIWVVLGGVSWRLMKKKIFFWYTHKAVTPKLKIAERLADVIFTASKESFRLSSKKVVVTGHGVNIELFKPAEVGPQGGSRTDPFKILSVGRISPVKNYGALIEAAKILKDNQFDFMVDLIGEAALERDRIYEGSLKSKIGELNLTANFNFVGKIVNKDLPSYYQSHDVFIHLSKTGSLDKSVLEAMSCGMTVLSSNDASRSFLPDELVFDDTNPRELADKIRKIDKGPVREDLRSYVVKNHNLDDLVNKISKIINE